MAGGHYSGCGDLSEDWFLMYFIVDGIVKNTYGLTVLGISFLPLQFTRHLNVHTERFFIKAAGFATFL
jgi:hypothetical protein